VAQRCVGLGNGDRSNGCTPANAKPVVGQVVIRSPCKASVSAELQVMPGSQTWLWRFPADPLDLPVGRMRVHAGPTRARGARDGTRAFTPLVRRSGFRLSVRCPPQCHAALRCIQRFVETPLTSQIGRPTDGVLARVVVCARMTGRVLTLSDSAIAPALVISSVLAGHPFRLVFNR
jgi:hypothetical protein